MVKKHVDMSAKCESLQGCLKSGELLFVQIDGVASSLVKLSVAFGHALQISQLFQVRGQSASSRYAWLSRPSDSVSVSIV